MEKSQPQIKSFPHRTAYLGIAVMCHFVTQYLARKGIQDIDALAKMVFGPHARVDYDHSQEESHIGYVAAHQSGPVFGVCNGLRCDLLHDTLNNLAPRFVLAKSSGDCPTYPACRHSRGYCDYPLKWEVESVSVELGRGRFTWKTLDDARDELSKSGYIVSDTPFGRGNYAVTHASTAETVKRKEEEDEKKWASARPCYLRYGDIPRGGRSKNHSSGTLELGVSAFYGLRLNTGEARVITRENMDYVSLFMIRDRPLYEVDGDEIGVGSDGEPVLADCRIISQVI